VCSLLDIPVYENPVESLHLLFSLYLEFKHNPVFGQQLLGDNGPGAVISAG
jgi:intraflagellar transport protein 46